MSDKASISEIFSKYASELLYKDIPGEVREVTKRSILDSIGIIIAASTQGVGTRELVELIIAAGGRTDSTILGFGKKVPSWMAAFANGAMARALDYDETLDDFLHHPSDVTVPATIAVAQQMRLNGKQLIIAVTIGNDIICRMLQSVSKRLKRVKFDWFYTSLFGNFGATLACGKLLGLNTAKMEDALGIALYQASGKGITGARRALEGEAGLFNMYLGGEYDRNILMSDLGKKFINAFISFKPWPGIRYNHSYIDATLQIMHKHRIAHRNVKKITLFVAGWVQAFCDPIEERRRPSTVLEAKRSLPYLVAVAATKGKILVEDITPDGIRAPDVLEFAEKITWEHDDRFSTENKIGPAMVRIELKNGECYTKELSVAYGHPQNPISWQDLTDKFRDCTSYSAKPISKENKEKAIAMIGSLEDIDNVSDIIDILA
jgi:2-methylcitrate dehydratase PrpD